jgi:hypothetical protein
MYLNERIRSKFSCLGEVECHGSDSVGSDDIDFDGRMTGDLGRGLEICDRREFVGFGERITISCRVVVNRLDCLSSVEIILNGIIRFFRFEVEDFCIILIMGIRFGFEF